MARGLLRWGAGHEQAFFPGVAGVTGGAGVAFGFDVLLADVTGHGLLAGNALLGQEDPLHRHCLLVDHRAFGVQGELVLFLADGRAR
jgi:hypothetical protein